MRVGFVVGEFPLLSETFVADQMAGLLERGFEVEVVCDRMKGDDRIDRQSEPMATLLARTRHWWSWAAGIREFVRRLPPGLRYKVSTALDMVFARRLNRCDVIVAHFGQNGERAAALKKWKFLKPPVITIFHGADVAIPSRQAVLATQYAGLIKHGTLNLTVNDFFRGLLLEAGMSPASTTVHHMGIDAREISYRWESWEGTPLIVTTVCRLVEKKGVEFALRALAELAASHPQIDWRYDIIGDGPLRMDLERLAAELGLTGRVTFLGSLPHMEVKRRLRAAHLFLLPSITASNGDMEGIPVALMEAMAAGLIAVSTVHSGIPELIQDLETGFLAPERDVSTLAGKLAWVAEHPKECEAVALAARRKVEEEFNADMLNERFAQIVTQLAALGSANESTRHISFAKVLTGSLPADTAPQ
ncbi:colanic acid biosynthesis glycosyltransferase WcaL [Mesorhizobium sp. M4B.F.Ca.ET.089.01.1.1]|uniref:glycosyltransferase n=1 Tax=Mesorhizobium sp. M4B.F.Ca.ET.089.01.1.1 TaxID=2496662 RepID=UPI000FE2E99A|nr:glycosyltransferase [Mesorhizobium sp. M4B.F.Ca.ET.089.01.1.1]RWX61715.1 colanic acid biosynthesis glycosyltransferase WcaL [Mesorhizobium sp. M4B.F.Ca.ET.089.01.1.1]